MKNKAVPEIILKEEIVYESPAFDVCRREVKSLKGKISTRSTIMESQAVIVVPLFRNNDVQLIHEYRAASQCWILQLPAGGIETGESPTDAAHRELAEEAGLISRSMVKIAGYYSSPGVSTEYLHVFIATELELLATRNLDVDEHIEPVIWSFRKCMDGIANQEIIDAKTIAALMHAALFTGRLEIKNNASF